MGEAMIHIVALSNQPARILLQCILRVPLSWRPISANEILDPPLTLRLPPSFFFTNHLSIVGVPLVIGSRRLSDEDRLVKVSDTSCTRSLKHISSMPLLHHCMTFLTHSSIVRDSSDDIVIIRSVKIRRNRNVDSVITKLSPVGTRISRLITNTLSAYNSLSLERRIGILTKDSDTMALDQHMSHIYTEEPGIRKVLLDQTIVGHISYLSRLSGEFRPGKQY